MANLWPDAPDFPEVKQDQVVQEECVERRINYVALRRDKKGCRAIGLEHPISL